MDGVPVKIAVINRPEYVIYLEPFCDRVWVHTDVFKWSSSVKKQFIQDLNTIPGPLYAMSVEPGRAKRNKFIKSLGRWKFYTTNEWGDVYRRP